MAQVQIRAPDWLSQCDEDETELKTSLEINIDIGYTVVLVAFSCHVYHFAHLPRRSLLKSVEEELQQR